MRKAFVEALVQAAEEDPRIWLLCGDLGYSVLEAFSRRFPDRYINCGVAEQNMVGVAAGLALDGAIPFVYSIANFATLRCIEQIRNDVVYHQLPVKVVAVGAGFSYGTAGFTHFAIEDLAIMRALSGMKILSPGDPFETRSAVKCLASDRGPGYLRLGKGGEPLVHQAAVTVEFGKSIRLQSGSRLTMLSSGGMLSVAQQAHQRLLEEGIDASLISMPSLAPLDEDAVIREAQATRRLLTIEEHGLGGLGSAVCELLARCSIHALVRNLHIPQTIEVSFGSQEAMRRASGLSLDQVIVAARDLASASTNLADARICP